MVGTSEESFFPLSKHGTKSPHTKFSGRGRVDVDDFVQSRAKYQKRKLYFWEKMNRLFLEYRIRDWRTFYLAMSRRMNKPELADMFPTGP